MTGRKGGSIWWCVGLALLACGKKGAAGAADAGDDDRLGLNPWCTVSSQPAGARVLVAGRERGLTPLKTRLEALHKNTVRVELDRYFPEKGVLEPNAHELTELSFVLRPAARVRLETIPPGATVAFQGDVVLSKTPGVTGPLPPGPVELVVTLPGYVGLPVHFDLLELTETPRTTALTPGVKLIVTSAPLRADVSLDWVLVGRTPLDVYAPPKGKHVLKVSKTGWSTITRPIADPKGTEFFSVTLIDLELGEARRSVAAARNEWEKASLALVRLQNDANEAADRSPGMVRRLAADEKVQENRLEAVETAEQALRALESRRAQE